MAKILNLDVVAPIEKRELVINGQAYVVKSMTVQDFCETTQLAEQLDKDRTLQEQIGATIDLVKRSIPDIDELTLRAMSMEQLRMVLQFARGADPVTIEADEKAEAGK